ncbi:MAG: M23 family metallopeptidase [Thermanaerothrix sp.]|uniref:M23 family metallopeptidase n=1 Tax=Thermanaerothrix sp. TaxID=2972675 RepID=UPI003C7C9F08
MVNDLLPLLLQRLLQPAVGESTRPDMKNEGEFAQILQAWLITSLSTSSTNNSANLSGTLLWSTLLETVIRQNLADEGVEEGLVAESGGEVTSSQPWPVQGRLTQEFHAHHRGIDIAVPVGTPVKTTISGRVVYAGWNNQGYGNLVIVENGPWRTYYAHLSEIPVQVGQWVEAGEVIGLSGNTGNSTGPHLHYEVRQQGMPVHPDELWASHSQI